MRVIQMPPKSVTEQRKLSPERALPNRKLVSIERAVPVRRKAA
jgi:hypothetical protein